MNRNTQNTIRSCKRFVASIPVLCALLSVLPSQNAYAQSGGWQPSKNNPLVAIKGSLGVKKDTSFLSAGDTISGTASITLVAPFDVTLRFVGFGDPVNIGPSPFQMSLHFEVSGLGVIYDGPAAGINNTTVTLPTSTNAAGIGLVLARKLIVTKDVPMGSYSDKGQIIITQI